MKRSDPWRWYCRLCGAEGEHDDELERTEAARDHARTEHPQGPGGQLVEDYSGRLMHVWTVSADVAKSVAGQAVMTPLDQRCANCRGGDCGRCCGSIESPCSCACWSRPGAS